MIKKYFRWILVISWMILIFIFSNQPGSISDKQSGFVIYIFNFIGLDLNSFFGEFANFMVRKTAHFSEYFILYILIYNLIKEEFKIDGLNVNVGILTALLITFLYACTDELHQIFVPGRAGRFKDVLIDTSGAAAAVGIMYLKRIKGGYKKKRCTT